MLEDVVTSVFEVYAKTSTVVPRMGTASLAHTVFYPLAAFSAS